MLWSARNNSLYLNDGAQEEQAIFECRGSGITAYIWVMGPQENSLYLGDTAKEEKPIFG